MIRNCLMISYDCFRADFSYSGKLSSVERLRKEGAAFARAISSAPLTPISHATVFTGLQPSGHGVRHLLKEKIRRDIPILAEILRDHGYLTAGFVACPGLNRWYGFDRGFTIYKDNMPLLPDGSDPMGCVDVEKRGLACRNAAEILAESIRFLRTQAHTPFFLFTHFFDAHWPYRTPDDFDPGLVNHPYEKAALYVDRHVSILLEMLDDMGIFDETLVVAFGDHGEDLNGFYPNDHGGVENGHPEEHGHGCLLYNSTQWVPLIFRFPHEVPAGLSVQSQVRLVDVMPTVLDLLQIKIPAGLDGETLKPLFTNNGLDRPAYFETFYLEEHPERMALGIGARGRQGIQLRANGNEWKAIWAVGVGSDSSEAVELYDLVRDPNEINNIFSASGCILGIEQTTSKEDSDG